MMITMLVGSYGLSAQNYIGIRGGYGAGSARFVPAEQTGFQPGLYSAGISYKNYSPPKYVGGVQIDLQFKQNGYMYDLSFGSDTSYHRTINSVELPLMWQPHINFVNGHARFFVNMGVNFYYHISSEEWKEDSKGEFDRATYQFGITRDNRLGYGLCGGAGLSYMTGRLEFAFEMRYNLGYSDVVKSKSRNRDNKWTRSPIDNVTGSLAVYYRLGNDTRRPPDIKYTRAEKAEMRRIRKEFNEPIPE